MPMVKADAYGLGVVPVVRALESLDPWGYGVATVTEGEELRKAHIHRPVLVTAPVEPHARPMKAIRAAKLIPSFGDATSIRLWMMTGGGHWHLAIDTGMNRAGIRYDEVGSLSEELKACPPAGAFTHFHSSELDDGSMELQTKRFRDAIAALPTEPALLHAENSAAIVRNRPSSWGMVRPGVFLYGVGSGAALKPEPVVHFRACVVDLHDLKPGDSVSYDATWKATRATRVATISAGYADGYRRSLGNAGTILIGGRRAKVVGTVTMDMTMVDVTDIPCERGDVVTLMGQDGEAVVTAEDVGAACGLSPYEILTALRARAPRVYL
jgi:alanine racemase